MKTIDKIKQDEELLKTAHAHMLAGKLSPLYVDSVARQNTIKLLQYLIEEDREAEKEYEVQSDGQYHFGENQKTTGFNQALTESIARKEALIKKLKE